MKRGATAANMNTKSKRPSRSDPVSATTESSQRKMITKKEDLEILSNPEISENDKKSYRYAQIYSKVDTFFV
jgi:hypothetical protein